MKRLFLPELVFAGGVFRAGLGVLARGGEILAVSDAQALAAAHPDAAREEMPDQALLPGCVNAHNHSFQSLLRGIAADQPFLTWRDRSLYRYSPRLDPDDLYWGAVFAFGEMLLCGVTTVCDFFYLHNHGLDSDEAIVSAARDVGIRLVLARAMYDWAGAPSGYRETIPQAVENTKRLAARYNGGGRTTILPAPHSLHAATLPMIRAGHDLARELDTRFHIHVAEEPFEVEEARRDHGMYALELLNHLGVVDGRMVIVHGVHLQPFEIGLLGAAGAHLAYCPSSNMFLADGVTDLPAMLAAGVRVGLGSDGGCSNNRVSVFEEMRMAALLQKAHTRNALCVTHEQTFRMGTRGGGELLELPVGEIAPGMRADLTGVDLSDLSLQPLFPSREQLLPHVVYSMQPAAVRTVIVDGAPVVRDGSPTRISKRTIRREAGRVLAGLADA